MTQLSTAVLARIDHVVETDIAVTTAGTIYYELTAKLEQADGDLFAQLDRAFVDLVAAVTAAAWADGYACGRNPDKLVFDAPPAVEPIAVDWLDVAPGVSIGVTAAAAVDAWLVAGGAE